MNILGNFLNPIYRSHSNKLYRVLEYLIIMGNNINYQKVMKIRWNDRKEWRRSQYKLEEKILRKLRTIIINPKRNNLE